MTNKTDNSLIKIFLPIINQGLISNGFNNVTVKQSYQPTMQGININPCVYFFKISNKRYGYLARYDKWNNESSTMIHNENQYYESTWQVQALVLQNPSDLTIPTASDLVNEVACIMQSDNTRYILNQSGIGILRIQDISNPYFFDDHDNFEASPNFNFILTYENFRVTTSPIIDSFTTNIHGV